MADKTKPATEAAVNIFAIEADNAITRNPADVPELAAVFSNQAELAALSANWPAEKLVNIWNRLPGVTALTKFSSRETAVRRIWAALSRPDPTVVDEIPAAPRQPARKRKASKKNEAGTKREKVIALLKRSEGATLKAIMMATGWQAHSVRGFISAQLTKKSGLKVKSFKRDGERVYRIRS